MKKLSKPQVSGEDAFSLCISKVRNAALKASLGALIPEIREASSQYESKARAGDFHSVPTSESVGDVPKLELLKVYGSRMAKIDAPGRALYDELISIPHSRCPLCGQRDVSTLDHYLPETRHSLIAVLPVNLVPACKDCNFNKSESYPSCSEDATFHPYYDDFDDADWLKAELVQGEPLGVEFVVVSPDAWSEVKFRRAQYHFRMMKLGVLYSNHAAGELVEVKLMMKKLFEVGGEQAVRQDLLERVSSIRVARSNYWRGALYSAAASSEWFCSGGFENIAE